MSTMPGELPAAFSGPVFRPGEPGFEEATRIWNARAASQTPALLVRPRDPDEVALAVRHAADVGLSIAVRGGGHGVDGSAMADGALVIDLSLMKKAEVDPEARRITVEAGVLLGEMDAAAQAHGLVVPAGVVSETGVAGLTLGGGIGHLSRRLGATVDNLISVDLVTVDGRRLTASADSYPELFWGMRGAGHNLAIATSFTFNAHPLGPEVMSGAIVYRPEEAIAFFSGIDEAMRRAPRELSIPLVLRPAPPLPGVPQDAVGAPVLFAIVIYTGPLEDYERAMEPVRELATPLVDMVAPSTWLQANSLVDPFEPSGLRYHTGGGYMPKMDGEIARIALERVSSPPTPAGPPADCSVTFPMLGGAMLDRDEDSTAFSRTGAEWLFEAIAIWADPETDHPYEEWVSDTMADLGPWMTSNAYVNLTADRGPEWLRGAYGAAAKWDRIVALKREWDPENRLRHNKNVAAAVE